ncbi:MAG: thioredoxin domain-containing protein [Planctomycetes bacterium]|nr:thioredoxin domain-containing protein [Planctomycetota bacterium]
MIDRWRQIARWLLLGAAAVSWLCAGCTHGGAEEDAGSPAASHRADLKLAVVDRDKYDAVIESHRGQVVLVDFWATWCMPCVQQFSHTVEVAMRFGSQGLVVVSVSCDEPTNPLPVVEFLRKKQAAGITNFISQFGGSPRSMEEFDISSGALPHYKLYDRAGRQRYTFELDSKAKDQFTLQDVDAAIERLLAE